jgi:hypothetical protein
MDWVRIQRLELDISLPFRLFDFFSGIDMDSGLGSEDISQWVFLLLGTVLMRYYHTENDLDLPRRALRKTFRFITLGIEGFLSEDGTRGNRVEKQAAAKNFRGVKKVLDPV